MYMMKTHFAVKLPSMTFSTPIRTIAPLSQNIGEFNLLTRGIINFTLPEIKGSEPGSMVIVLTCNS